MNWQFTWNPLTWEWILVERRHVYCCMQMTLHCWTTLKMTYIISSKLPSDRLWLFRRSVNCWRVSAHPQQFIDRLNNHRRSRELRNFCTMLLIYNLKIRVITKLPNSEQSSKGKVKTHNYINRQNQSTTGKLWKP
jgi:hypothetical protein